MRTFRSVRADLERLEDTLQRMPEDSASPAASLMRRGLAEMHEDVSLQAEQLRRSRLKVVLQGLPVVGHEIRVNALVKLLDSLQESVTAVAQAMTGRATGRSSVPGPVREATALRLASVFPGSFGAILNGPTETDEHPEQPLFDWVSEVPTMLDGAIDTLLNIIDLAGSDQLGDDPIVDVVLPLGSRTFKHLADLSGVIASEEISADIVWTSPSQIAERRVQVTRDSAQRLSDVLGRNRVTESEETLVGRLGTVSDIRNRIELEADDGQIFSATVVDELLGNLGQLFAHRVSARVDVSTVRSLVNGSERKSYTVVDLEMAPEPDRLRDDGA